MSLHCARLQRFIPDQKYLHSLTVGMGIRNYTSKAVLFSVSAARDVKLQTVLAHLSHMRAFRLN